MRTRTGIILLAATAAATSFVVAGTQGGFAASEDDPATATIPTYDYADPAKSFVVDLQFGASSAGVLGATVGPDRSRSHIGDPPLLRLVLRDEDGNQLDAMDSWDPRWVFDQDAGGAEHLVVDNTVKDALVVPFDGDAGSMLVRDQVAGVNLVEVDLTGAVHDFCVAHPTDDECVEADLAVPGSAATGTTFSVVGATLPVSVSAVVANLGPDGPVDADVTQTATAGAGVSVTPAGATYDVDALAVGAPRTVQRSYDVTCLTPGVHSVTFGTSVVPEKAKVVDAVAGNNSAAATYTVDCAVPVHFEVKPGQVNINGGVLPTEVSTTKAGDYGLPIAFDAQSIQVATVRIGQHAALVATNTGAPEAHGKSHGGTDAVLHARRDEIPLVLGMTEVCVRGKFGPGAGTSFFGCAPITVKP